MPEKIYIFTVKAKNYYKFPDEYTTERIKLKGIDFVLRDDHFELLEDEENIQIIPSSLVESIEVIITKS